MWCSYIDIWKMQCVKTAPSTKIT